MKAKKLVVGGMFAALIVALVATSVSLVCVCRKVRTFEREHGGDVLANLDKADLDKKVKDEIAAAATPDLSANLDKAGLDKKVEDEIAAAATPDLSANLAKADLDKKVKDEIAAAATPTAPSLKAKPSRSPQLKVLHVDYDGDSTLSIIVSDLPDMDVAGSYISVEPLAKESKLVVTYANEWRPLYSQYNRWNTIKVRGNFPYRTDLTLCVRAGLPLHGKRADGKVKGSLRDDVIYCFRRSDAPPTVDFAANGRYLPPGGERRIALEAVNVTNILARISRVEPRNVVGLLAREEGVWRVKGNADSCLTEDFSGAIEEHIVKCDHRPNEKERVSLPVAMNDGGATNGIYLVAVRDGDRPPNYSRWGDKKDYNPTIYRLVCLSDLGLSVRETGTDSPVVWATSLLTGRPVGGVTVEIYSKSNTKIMEGTTGADGLCRPARVAKGAPFAVVASTADGSDGTFMALRSSMAVDETWADGTRAAFLGEDECTAFVWTDRGIYRHDEKIMLHALLRNGRRRAPPEMPVEIVLVDPRGAESSKTLLTDENGSVFSDGFSVPAGLPSGVWQFLVRVPGAEGRVFGVREIKIEEFAPPQIRVAVSPGEACHPSNFAFSVSAEHLFGGPAHALRCEGAVVFEDVDFAPAGWKGWRFGNDFRSLKPSFRRLGACSLDRAGACSFAAPLWADSGLPKAAVRATAQGVVFEDGGRAATARASCVLDYYPYYIGATLGSWLREEPGKRPVVRLACVKPDGTRLGEARRLVAKLDCIENICSCKKSVRGWYEWDCTRVRRTLADDIKVETSATEDTFFEIPVAGCGDYALEITDPETQISFGASFYLGEWEDDEVRASLSAPTAVTLVPDKAFYRSGETPRLRVRSPFAGSAMVSVMRDEEVYTEVIALSNATSEIVLRPVSAEDAPNLDVHVSVVQSVAANAKHLATRAHGQTTVCIRPAEDEIAVAVAEAKVATGADSLASIHVAFDAPGAEFAIVTIVDEGINLLTGERTPDPVGHFAAPRTGGQTLYDIFHRILPVVQGEDLGATGIQTGGGAGAEMLGRVSPVPTRRFKPLALWSGVLRVGADGKGEWTARLPEFAGEVRATVVAWSATASGASASRVKVAPKVVIQPDAPRFAAPGDVFDISLPVYDRSGAGTAGTIAYSILANGKSIASGAFELADGAATNIVVRAAAGDSPGELALVYRVEGRGEKHEKTILLPVRPAVAWVETAGVRRFAGTETVATNSVRNKGFERYSEKICDSPLGECEAALAWLADYPYGCLEQTTSRIFPLVGAGGLLASISPVGEDVVRAGISRVESMVRATDFTMWPDCSYAPWDREVSLYAAHFLVEAKRCGYKLNPVAFKRVEGFLARWAMSVDAEVSAYACHTLALAGKAERDRMLRLYDASGALSLLARARLSRAFALSGDSRRAAALLAANVAPSSVKEAAFAVLALLEIDPEDPRILQLVARLNALRDRSRFSWGTTSDNAHALLAIASYYRHHPAKEGEKFVMWRRLSLPKIEDVKDESSGLEISRRFLTPEGKEADLANLGRGEMLIAEIKLRACDTYELSDLVIEDLLPACFEPIHGPAPLCDRPSWTMRSDAQDDRVLVFSKKFLLAKSESAIFCHPVRVVSSGEFVLPGPSVEAMYFTGLHARQAPGRIVVSR